MSIEKTYWRKTGMSFGNLDIRTRLKIAHSGRKVEILKNRGCVVLEGTKEDDFIMGASPCSYPHHSFRRCDHKVIIVTLW